MLNTNIPKVNYIEPHSHPSLSPTLQKVFFLSFSGSHPPTLQKSVFCLLVRGVVDNIFRCCTSMVNTTMNKVKYYIDERLNTPMNKVKYCMKFLWGQTC